MVSRFAAALGLLSVLLLSACAASSTGTAPSSRNAAITTEQIRDTGASTAYDAVQTLRPMWLQKRGENSINAPTEILVYMNNARLGGIESLRQIAAADVRSIEFVDARAAQFRWGPGHTQGVILVQTR